MILDDIKARRWDRVWDTMKEEWPLIAGGGLILGCLILIAVAIPMAINEDKAYTQKCEAAGGHVVRKTTTNTGISSDGKPVTTHSTLRFCLTDDGRMIEVE